MTDLCRGDVFEGVPILRVRFCDGTTKSLLPAELWRGRYTVGSVLETVAQVLAVGLEPALEWTLYAGHGEAMVSERSLRRWQQRVVPRLTWATWADLGLAGELAGQTVPGKLADLQDRLTGQALLRFRARRGYGLLDRPPPLPSPASTAARLVPGRLVPAPPPDPPSVLRPRGAWSVPAGRGPPRDRTPEGGAKR